FVDPPYTGVHYSRFYHVLETIARKGCSGVSGVGRYPPQDERPSSSFSTKTTAVRALERLFDGLGGSGCTVVFTFPVKMCSNGLSGDIVKDVAAQKFRIRSKTVKTNFSTLGGNNTLRSSREPTNELVMLMRPK